MPRSDKAEQYRKLVMLVLEIMPGPNEFREGEIARVLNDPNGLKRALRPIFLQPWRNDPEIAQVLITDAFTAERVAQFNHDRHYATRICRVAEREGWRTIGDIAAKSFKDLSRSTPGMNQKSAFLIQAILHGVYFLDLATE